MARIIRSTRTRPVEDTPEQGASSSASEPILPTTNVETYGKEFADFCYLHPEWAGMARDLLQEHDESNIYWFDHAIAYALKTAYEMGLRRETPPGARVIKKSDSTNPYFRKHSIKDEPEIKATVKRMARDRFHSYAAVDMVGEEVANAAMVSAGLVEGDAESETAPQQPTSKRVVRRTR